MRPHRRHRGVTARPRGALAWIIESLRRRSLTAPHSSARVVTCRFPVDPIPHSTGEVMSYPQGPPGGPGYPPAAAAELPSSPRRPSSSARSLNPNQPPKAPRSCPLYLRSQRSCSVCWSTCRASARSSRRRTPELAVQCTRRCSSIRRHRCPPGRPDRRCRPAAEAARLHGARSGAPLLSFLLVISVGLTAPSGVTIDWGLYLLVAFTRSRRSSR